MNERFFALSDIHGMYDKFMSMLELIKFTKDDTMFILGDVIDRGEFPIKTLQYIISQKNMVMINGNHEDMFIQTIIHRNDNKFSLYIANGGGTTIGQFLDLEEKERIKIINFLQEKINTPVIEFNDFLLVHAGFDCKKTLENQDYNNYIWIREDFYTNKGYEGKTIIFGHTPTYNLHRKHEIWHDTLHNNDKIGIDCGAYYGGKLCCVEMDAKEIANVFYT